MIDDLIWSPVYGQNYESEFRQEDPLIKDFKPDEYPRLCCDDAFQYCVCPVTDEIGEDDVKDYLLFHKIELNDVYERDMTHCISCEHYATNACIPLRHIIRYFDKTNTLPFFALTECKHYLPDEDYISNTNVKVNGATFNKDLEGYIAH